MRLTVDARDRIIAVHFKRLSKAQIDASFRSELAMNFRAEILLTEVKSEYFALFSAPFMGILLSD